MPIQITTAQIINQDGPEIAKDVDHVAMALFEAVLNSANRSSHSGDAHGPGTFNKHEYNKAKQEIRNQLVIEHGPLVHLLYWFDARASYWERATPDADPSDILQVLRDLLNKAKIIKVEAETAQARANQARAKSTSSNSPIDDPLSAAINTIDAIVQLAEDYEKAATAKQVAGKKAAEAKRTGKNAPDGE
jgi:hypothetical protein